MTPASPNSVPATADREYAVTWEEARDINRRRQRILSTILTKFERQEELENGYLLAYPVRRIAPGKLLEYLMFLRTHHRALTFEVVAGRDPAYTWIRITGSTEDKAFLNKMLHAPPFESRLQHVLRRGGRMLTRPWRVLPDFLIIGVAKGGTTSLYDALIQHPGVAPAARKEVYYFDRWYERGLPWYRSHFPTARTMRQCAARSQGVSLTGEATPCYMIHPHVPRRIRAVLPGVRLIVLLRNPVERAYSFWQMQYRRGHEGLGFEAALDCEEARLAGEWEKMLADERYNSHTHHRYSYLCRGHYADQLERWFAVFPREQFLILKSETLYADPAGTLDHVYRFLGLPAPPAAVASRYKRVNYVPYEGMSPATRLRLQHYFAPHNARLCSLLGRDFGWDG